MYSWHSEKSTFSLVDRTENQARGFQTAASLGTESARDGSLISTGVVMLIVAEALAAVATGSGTDAVSLLEDESFVL
jgi:hypothetical protein